MFTLYKMTFYRTFLTVTVKVKNKNKIDDIKIMRNLLAELESSLERCLKRNSLRILLHNRIKRKFGEERVYPRYRL